MLAKLPYYGDVAVRFRRHAAIDWDISNHRAFGEDSEGSIASQVWDFQMEHYVYFLDNVSSSDALIRGLNDLDPFVDDALKVAQLMTEVGFASFKLALIHERKVARNEAAESIMPKEFSPVVLPLKFLWAMQLAHTAKVAMGTALIRTMEEEIVAI